VNKDQIEGAAKNIGGKVEEKIGKLVDSKEQQGKGLKRQIDGKVQQHIGDIKADLKDLAG